MTFKRNMDINVKENLNVSLKHLLDSGYECNICLYGCHIMAKHYTRPTAAFGRQA